MAERNKQNKGHKKKLVEDILEMKCTNFRKSYDLLNLRNQQRRADIFAKWIFAATCGDHKRLGAEGLDCIHGNRQLAVTCMNMIQMISLLIEK